MSLDAQLTEAVGRPAAPPRDPGAGPDLPSEPLVRIKRGSGWAAVDLRELWSYRELLYFLALRDVMLRYKQTALGVVWVVLQPLLTMLIFAFVFSRVPGLAPDGLPYPLFAYSGLVLWTFFASALSNSGNSLVGNAHLISKVYFPRVVVPTAAVAAGLVDLLFNGVVLVIVMACYGFAPSWRVVMVVPLLSLLTLLALGVGLWLSAMNVRYRDVRYALPFLVQVWMFASPIIYSLSLIPEKYRWVMALNPVAGIVEGFRAALFDHPFDWPALGASAAITAAILLYAAFDFRRMERSFADIV